MTLRNPGSAIAAIGVATILSIGTAGAQSNGASGTGSATQENRPSTVGVGNPGGPTAPVVTSAPTAPGVTVAPVVPVAPSTAGGNTTTSGAAPGGAKAGVGSQGPAR